MLVEDIPAMRTLIRQMLRSLGFDEIVEVPDGSAALQRLLEQPIDIILSDWNMVPMTGLQLLRAIRDEPELAHIPFIMITGRSEVDDVAIARKAGVNGYLIKPFGLQTLARQLSRAVMMSKKAA